jgi:hypothetical protein
MIRARNELEDAMQIISVAHESKDGWHKFTSPEMPGLYIVAAPDNLEAAYEDIPRAIEELIFADTGRRVTVQLEKDRTGLASHPRPRIQRYFVEFFAA